MPTVKELIEVLRTMPEHYEVLIYPKYTGSDMSSFKKYTFRAGSVHLQEPSKANFRDKNTRMKAYFKDKKPLIDYNYCNHVAIII